MRIISIALLTIILAACADEQNSDRSVSESKKNTEPQTEVKDQAEADNEVLTVLGEDSLEVTSIIDEQALILEQESKMNNEEIMPEEIAYEIEENSPNLVESNVPVEVPNDVDFNGGSGDGPGISVEVAAKVKIDHLAWDALVRKNVSSSGKVNYKGFKSNTTALNVYLTALSKEAPGSDWSRNEKLAFWINAYNAFTVKLIIDNYPLKSITDIPKAWDTKNIKIADKMYSLGVIENDILRKMNEPRIHFAINCASESCPNLLNKAFLPSKLSSQLSQVTKSFFTDESKNDFSGKTIKISKLFDWYSVDFSKGDIIKYINANRTDQLSDKTKISYLEYDWSLNE